MYNFKLKNFLFFLVIATMMVPFEILMLPLYKEIIALHLIDTYTGVIIIGLCNASTIFFFRQYLSGLPRELLDAARIDGATEYGIATKIILPLTKPAFASMGILQAMGSMECDPVAASGTEGSRKVHPSDRIKYIADAVRKQL